MDTTINFNNTIFPIPIIRESIKLWESQKARLDKIETRRTIKSDNQEWSFDSDEDFFNSLNNNFEVARLKKNIWGKGKSINIVLHKGVGTTVEISLETKEEIQDIANVFIDSRKDYISKLDTIENPDPRKRKTYKNIKFTPSKIQEIAKRFSKNIPNYRKLQYNRQINFGGEKWSYSNDAEFFTDYSKVFKHSQFDITYWLEGSAYYSLSITHSMTTAEITIKGPPKNEIQDIFLELERDLSTYMVEEESINPDIKIFIGHGRNDQWKEIKNHLNDKHGYSIEAYETGARAGHTIRDILTEMMTNSSFAILVLTGEDELKSGEIYARPNVIHETGLFQGKLGFNRAIVLLEEGTNEFSNLFGIQQIRFSKSNIKETYGEVLATIKREFNNAT